MPVCYAERIPPLVRAGDMVPAWLRRAQKELVIGRAPTTDAETVARCGVPAAEFDGVAWAWLPRCRETMFLACVFSAEAAADCAS